MLHPSSFKHHPLALSIATLFATSVITTSSQAAIRTWDGNGADDNWSYLDANPFSPSYKNTNWTDSAGCLFGCFLPVVNGDSLVFAGNSRLSPNNDLSNGSYAGISFDANAEAFTLNGNEITSTGNINNYSNHIQTIYMPITVGSDQVWDGGSKELHVIGDVLLGNHNLILQNHTSISINDKFLNNNFIIGENGTTSLTLKSGSVVRSTSSMIGNLGGNGNVTVDGMGSLFFNTEHLIVGGVGNGSLTIQNGAKVSNQSGIIGIVRGFIGLATVSGADSTWTNRGALRVGNFEFANGTLNITNGGKVTSDETTLVGFFENANGLINVDGANSQLEQKGTFVIGNMGTGKLSISNGGLVSNLDGYLGKSSKSTGVATVMGVNTLWTNHRDLFIGMDGSGMLTIQNGGTVSVGNNLSIGNQGILNLVDGKLSVQAFSANIVGQFNWSSGVLNLTDTSGVTLGNNVFTPSITSLTTGKTLEVNNSLIINTGNYLLLDGGQVKASTLALRGGVIAGTAFDTDNIGLLSGYGTVAVPITGGTAANTIQASGGNLDLGTSNSTTGFDFGGNLKIGSKQVNLLDQDQANLGVSTSISDGGRLNAANGAVLSAGETLDYTGNASILGNFTNNGTVSGSGGTLTFLNDVNGKGSFAGDIAFHADYAPGNSPAAVDFNGGNASFDSSSVLTMEIFGANPGSQYDQLLNINHLDFNGILNLVFAPGFTPSAGQIFALLDFKTFSGSLAADRIIVSGIDRNLFDFSNFASNGSFQLAAVPLPAGMWLFGSGLALLSLARRKTK